MLLNSLTINTIIPILAEYLTLLSERDDGKRLGSSQRSFEKAMIFFRFSILIPIKLTN